jgi:hypothetical protein
MINDYPESYVLEQEEEEDQEDEEGEDDGDDSEYDEEEEENVPLPREAVKKQRKKKPTSQTMVIRRRTVHQPSVEKSGKDHLQINQDLVDRLKALGMRFHRKNAAQKMHLVNKLTKNDMSMLTYVIRNIFEGGEEGFQIDGEELHAFRPYKELLKEYLKKRTPLKRRREILLEGQILKNLSELMSHLEIGEH